LGVHHDGLREVPFSGWGDDGGDDLVAYVLGHGRLLERGLERGNDESEDTRGYASPGRSAAYPGL
jgi:hypothetical protein